MDRTNIIGKDWAAENEKLKAESCNLEANLKKVTASNEALQEENDQLRARLQEAHEHIRRIDQNASILSAQMDVVRMIFG